MDQETNNISEADLTPDIWPEVDKADLAEIKQFVEESAFKKIHKSQITSEMVVVDAIWVRKKKRYPDGSIRIKSRLCARGFLDAQKSMLTTRSTTATRLSQRLLVSYAAQDEERDVESLDVGGAFLKGFSFQEIQKVLREQGHQAPSRTVILLPPLNVYKHLASLSDDFKIPEASIFDYGLLCVKPVYGLNDAPLAWQLCLHDFIKHHDGHPSKMDENTFMWKKDGALVALATTHVDDIALTASKNWLNTMHGHFVKRFNKITRQQLPFNHCGCFYERLPDGYRISQADFAKKLEKVKIPEKGDSEKLTPAETSSLRSILGALLWVTATRLDVVADVSILQSRVTVAEIRDLKYANQVVDKVKEFQDVGLHYRFLKTNNLRLACIHDASSASQGRHYAQEGLLICLTEDKFYNENLNYETIFNDGDGPDGVDRHGGVMHVLHASGTKAKRVSYSTSHAETLSMINGVESSTLILVRLSELLHPEPAPSLLQLTKIQEEGNKLIPVDYYGDCRDVFELVTGERTLPQDKGQRLYVLSIKEARLMGKIRMLTLIPTQCMTADSLTKSMIHASMLLLLTTGIIKFFEDYAIDQGLQRARFAEGRQADAEGDQGEAGTSFSKLCDSALRLHAPGQDERSMSTGFDDIVAYGHSFGRALHRQHREGEHRSEHAHLLLPALLCSGLGALPGEALPLHAGLRPGAPTPTFPTALEGERRDRQDGSNGCGLMGANENRRRL